jgi:hypothetical protein
MNGSARRAAFCAILLLTASTAYTQSTLQPTAPPLVTANNEGWYLKGEPVLYAGNIYYPAGPQVHFNANEMVRSGFYQGVPLYAKTTIEPYSIVYVPLQGGLMQPYERPRTGELAGTVGSTTPSFPVARAPELAPLSQAAASPVLAAPVTLSAPVVSAAGPQAVGTSGRVTPTPAVRPATTPIRRRASSIFIEFGSDRWFSSGTPVVLDATRFVRIGEYHGFPVYTLKNGLSSTIYVPLAGDQSEFVTPYSRRRGR